MPSVMKAIICRKIWSTLHWFSICLTCIVWAEVLFKAHSCLNQKLKQSMHCLRQAWEDLVNPTSHYFTWPLCCCRCFLYKSRPFPSHLPADQRGQARISWLCWLKGPLSLTLVRLSFPTPLTRHRVPSAFPGKGLPPTRVRAAEC